MTVRVSLCAGVGTIGRRCRYVLERERQAEGVDMCWSGNVRPKVSICARAGTIGKGCRYVLEREHKAGRADMCCCGNHVLEREFKV